MVEWIRNIARMVPTVRLEILGPLLIVAVGMAALAVIQLLFFVPPRAAHQMGWLATAVISTGAAYVLLHLGEDREQHWRKIDERNDGHAVRRADKWSGRTVRRAEKRRGNR